MKSFRWLATEQVVERILTLRSNRDRQKFNDFFSRLAGDPEGLAQDSFDDSEGNLYYATHYEHWIITYHIDDALKQVILLALEMS
ncbi:MAG: hypothetical protein HRU10_13545 [Opitutales bacterium]|nr:hypothetical protein [Opitutales bacterium]